MDNLEKIHTMKQGLAARLLSGKLIAAAAWNGVGANYREALRAHP